MDSIETNNEDNVFLFKCIVDFIHSLNELYGEKYHNLQLYDLLMDKTGIVHEEPIRKHIHLFYDFVRENEDSILERNLTLIKVWKIEYSEKVFIDLKPIFEEANNEDKQCIWNHLLTLLAILIPTSKAKQILKEMKEKKKKKGNEEDFLTNIMDKVGQHINPSTSSNPAEMMNDIMGSGLFTELMSDMNKGMSNGDLDVNVMMGSLQNMIGRLSNMIDKPNS